MTNQSARAVCLDASILVKLRVEEPHSAAVRVWYKSEPAAYTTPFCFYEALNIFKSKWKYQRKITESDYTAACSSLITWFGGKCRADFVKDKELVVPEAFQWVREVVQSTKLDFSDAYQLYSVKYGYFSRLPGDSRTVLATTDAELASVARAYGLLAINLTTEREPK